MDSIKNKSKHKVGDVTLVKLDLQIVHWDRAYTLYVKF